MSRWLGAFQWPDASYIDHLCSQYGWTVEEQFSATPNELDGPAPMTVKSALHVLIANSGFKQVNLIPEPGEEVKESRLCAETVIFIYSCQLTDVTMPSVITTFP